MKIDGGRRRVGLDCEEEIQQRSIFDLIGNFHLSSSKYQYPTNYTSFPSYLEFLNGILDLVALVF